MLTWNIFFDKRKLKERTKKILELSHNANVEIILYQEVSIDILNILIESMNSGGFYLPSERIQTERVKHFKYSTLSFVKLKYENVEVRIIPFKQSFMGRDILEIRFGTDCQYRIYNIHLESLNTPQFRKIREDQLNYLLEYMSKGLHVNSIACGDFNYREPIINGNITDLLSSISINNNTYFANRFNKSDYKAAYDRILYHKNGSCQFISYIGDKYYPDIGYCSDHNGIIFSIDSH